MYSIYGLGQIPVNGDLSARKGNAARPRNVEDYLGDFFRIDAQQIHVKKCAPLAPASAFSPTISGWGGGLCTETDQSGNGVIWADLLRQATIAAYRLDRRLAEEKLGEAKALRASSPDIDGYIPVYAAALQSTAEAIVKSGIVPDKLTRTACAEGNCPAVTFTRPSEPDPALPPVSNLPPPPPFPGALPPVAALPPAVYAPPPVYGPAPVAPTAPGYGPAPLAPSAPGPATRPAPYYPPGASGPPGLTPLPPRQGPSLMAIGVGVGVLGLIGYGIYRFAKPKPARAAAAPVAPRREG